MQYIYTVQMRLSVNVEVLLNPGRRKQNDVEFPLRVGSRFCFMWFVFFKQLKMLVSYFAYHYRVTEGLPL